MTAKTMAEVLAEHQWYDATSDNEDPATGCTGCDDWFGSEDALDDGTFAAHQADALSAAGFGLLADAKAAALEQAADALDRVDRIAATPINRVTPEEEAEYMEFAKCNGDKNWLRARAAALRAVS